MLFGTIVILKVTKRCKKYTDEPNSFRQIKYKLLLSQRNKISMLTSFASFSTIYIFLTISLPLPINSLCSCTTKVTLKCIKWLIKRFAKLSKLNSYLVSENSTISRVFITKLAYFITCPFVTKLPTGPTFNQMI